MAITTDWHIHTHCSCDSACMEFETLVEEAKKLGITDFGVSDHYHSRIQEADIAASRKEFEKTLKNHPELKGHFHFGIEATLMSKWEIEKIAKGEYTDLPVYGFRSGGPENAELIFDLDQEFLDKYKIEYFIAGMHWPMYCKTDKQSLLTEYHRQYMYCATHPFTDILAHYCWWDETLFKINWGLPDAQNPFTYFSDISQTMRSELVAALKENNVAFELNTFLFGDKNAESMRDEYLGFVADIQRSGVVISMGSDSHSPRLSDGCDYKKCAEIFGHYGIDTSKFYCL